MSCSAILNQFQPITQLTLNALNGFTLFDLFDDALADLLCLRTYTHGTSPRNYYQIIYSGVDTHKGGLKFKGEGAFHQFIGRERPDSSEWDSRGRFYVCEDDCRMDCGPEILSRSLGELNKKMLPRVYATITSIGELYVQLPPETSSRVFSIVVGYTLGLFSPTLKLRFLPEEIRPGFFEKDSTFEDGLAVYTTEQIAQDHIGLYGTLLRALDGSLIDRIQNNPARFLWGIVKTVMLATASLFTIALLFSPPTMQVACGLLLLEAALCIGRLAIPILANLVEEER